MLPLAYLRGAPGFVGRPLELSFAVSARCLLLLLFIVVCVCVCVFFSFLSSVLLVHAALSLSVNFLIQLLLLLPVHAHVRVCFLVVSIETTLIVLAYYIFRDQTATGFVIDMTAYDIRQHILLYVEVALLAAVLAFSWWVFSSLSSLFSLLSSLFSLLSLLSLFLLCTSIVVAAPNSGC